MVTLFQVWRRQSFGKGVVNRLQFLQAEDVVGPGAPEPGEQGSRRSTLLMVDVAIFRRCRKKQKARLPSQSGLLYQVGWDYQKRREPQNTTKVFSSR